MNQHLTHYVSSIILRIILIKSVTYIITLNGMEWNGMEWNGMEWNGM